MINARKIVSIVLLVFYCTLDLKLLKLLFSKTKCSSQRCYFTYLKPWGHSATLFNCMCLGNLTMECSNWVCFYLESNKKDFLKCLIRYEKIIKKENFIYLFIYLLTCLFIYLFIYLFVYLFVYLFIYLFIYMFSYFCKWNPNLWK